MKKKKYLVWLCVLLCMMSSVSLFADGFERITLGKNGIGFIVTEEAESESDAGNYFILTSYDLGAMGLTGADQEWITYRLRVGYLLEGMQFPYFEVNRFSRNSLINYTYDIGGYFRVTPSSYAHLAAGWGADVIYQYNFKLQAEYTHPLTTYVYMKEKYKYYNTNNENIHILSPGLMYYFDDHYFLTYYNLFFSDQRESSSWLSLKLNFSVLEDLDFWIGAEIGQRLYDMTGAYTPSIQEGYVLFTGYRYQVTDALSMYINLLYGYEEPDYHHKSCEIGAMYVF